MGFYRDFDLVSAEMTKMFSRFVCVNVCAILSMQVVLCVMQFAAFVYGFMRLNAYYIFSATKHRHILRFRLTLINIGGEFKTLSSIRG